MEIEQQRRSWWGHFLVVPTLLVFLVSCGGPNGGALRLVRDVHLESSLDQSSGDLLIKTKASFWMGNLHFPSLTVPIRSSSAVDKDLFGEISFMKETNSNTSSAEFWLDLSKVVKFAELSEATLPNGEAIPVQGLAGSKMYQLAMDQLHSRMYMTLDDQAVMVGFSLGIKQISLIKKWMKKSTMFFGFHVNGLFGSVGIFTGDLPEQNGLAFFLDLSPVLSPDIINRLFAGEAIADSTLDKAKSSENISRLVFTESSTGTGSLENLNQAKAQLQKIVEKKEALEFVKTE